MNSRFKMDYHDEDTGEIEVYDNAIGCSWFGKIREKNGEQRVDRTAWRDDHDSSPSMDLMADLGDFVRNYLAVKDLM